MTHDVFWFAWFIIGFVSAVAIFRLTDNGIIKVKDILLFLIIFCLGPIGLLVLLIACFVDVMNFVVWDRTKGKKKKK